MFPLIPHQFVFLPSVRLPAAFFHLLIPFSSFFDFPPAQPAFPDVTAGINQIHSSVFKFLPPSSSFFDLPGPSMTLGLAQFILFRSSSLLDLPSLCSSIFDEEEHIGNSDRIDDKQKIGMSYGKLM
jgi:hypothetical protein